MSSLVIYEALQCIKQYLEINITKHSPSENPLLRDQISGLSQQLLKILKKAMMIFFAQGYNNSFHQKRGIFSMTWP